MLEHPWNIVFLAGFVVFAAIRHVFEGRARGGTPVIRRIDGVEKALLGLMMLGSLIIPMTYVFSSVLSFADYAPPATVPWVGAVVMVLSLWMFRRSHSDLGRNWSVSLEIRADHELVTRGVYRRIRHPMYTSIWLWGVAQALLLANWIAGFSFLAAFAPMYFIRTPREERMMLERFGAAYADYMQRTGRILPRFK